jgi:hypothetical protein
MVNAGKVMKCEFIGSVEAGVSSLLKVLFQYLLERVQKNKIQNMVTHFLGKFMNLVSRAGASQH